MSGPAADSAALVIRTGEQVVEGTGADVLGHLDATTTQALKEARPGTATAALVLDAKGDPLAMFDVLVLPDRVWLITPGADVTDVVMRIIAGRTFLADARFALLDHEVVRVHGTPGSDLGALARTAWSGVAVTPEPGTLRTTPSGDVMVAATATATATATADATAGEGATLTLAGPAAEVEGLVGRLVAAGATEGGVDALAGWRIAVGRPAWGHEVTPPHLPEELGLLPTHVHLAKGCYPGQEAVARMWMLGRPRRRLARVRLTGPAAADVSAGHTIGTGRDAVELTTVDASGALAFVPGGAEAGQRLGDDATLRVEVVALVGDDPQPPALAIDQQVVAGLVVVVGLGGGEQLHSGRRRDHGFVQHDQRRLVRHSAPPGVAGLALAEVGGICGPGKFGGEPQPLGAGL